MDEYIATEIAYKNGYEAGQNAIFDEIDDILDRCARDNGEMIVRALKELKKKIAELTEIIASKAKQMAVVKSELNAVIFSERTTYLP